MPNIAVKQFLQHLKSKDVEWKDAYEVESSRKKGKVNKYKTYEADRTKKGSVSYGFIAAQNKKMIKSEGRKR